MTGLLFKIKVARLKSIFVKEGVYEGLRDQRKRQKVTKRVLRIAWNLGIGVPDRNNSNYWQNSFGTPVGVSILTWDGIELMKKRILDLLKTSLKIIGGIAALIGSLVALFA